MKLITEEFVDTEILHETNEHGKKELFIEGIFLQANLKNRNGRVYPKPIMEKEVKRYIAESIDIGHAFGELGHPASGPTINPDKISHLIVSLKEDGNNYIGKAKILSTPMGEIARSIMEGGGRLAVSSRGIGSIKKVNGIMEVQSDFRLAVAGDIVINPSAPDAYVDAIMEAPEWIFNSVTNEWMMAEAIAEASQITKKNLDEAHVLAVFAKFVKSFK